MKKTLLMACAFVALTAGIAAAGPGGLNLSWLDCGVAGVDNRVFACTSNSGSNILVGSFVAPCCVTAASANEIVMDVQTTGASLAPWWGMRTGACRAATSLTLGLSFVTDFSCYDYWQNSASGGISEDAPIGNRVRIKALAALPAGNPAITAIAEGTEVYSFKAFINNAKTAGLGACAGCLDGACIVLNSIKINQPVSEPGGSKFVSAPANRNHVTWQGGIGIDCLGATPTKNSTWGQVKSLYR